MCCLPADRCAGAAAHHIKLVQQIGRNMFLTLRELEESIGFWKAKKTSSILVFRGVLISYSYSIVMSRDFAYSSARTVGFRMLSKTCLHTESHLAFTTFSFIINSLTKLLNIL